MIEMILVLLEIAIRRIVSLVFKVLGIIQKIEKLRVGSVGKLDIFRQIVSQSENYGNKQFKNFLNNKMNSRNGKNVLTGNKKGSK